MRLREPFSGCKLSSGHYLFHLAYFCGSFHVMKYKSTSYLEDEPRAENVLLYLRITHLVVPLFRLLGFISHYYHYYSVEKVLDIHSIFCFQITIFYCQMHQMNSKAVFLEGYNLWFTIELLSFYGYMGAACLFILERAIRSSFGWINKELVSDCYKHDFITFHEQDIMWQAMIFIMFLVNANIIYLNLMIRQDEPNTEGETVVHNSLKKVMYLLLFCHTL